MLAWSVCRRLFILCGKCNNRFRFLTADCNNMMWFTNNYDPASLVEAVKEAEP
jgi:hypothetical protein